MAKQTYLGVDNVARKVKKVYIGVDNKARKVKKMYIGVNNVARLFFNGGLRMIAGGQGYFNCYTDDGTTWTKTSKDSTSVTGIAAAYGNGTFVVIGGGTAHRYSKDGVLWTTISALDGKFLYDIAFCKDRFVAGGADGIAYYSYDGISWTAMPALSGAIKSICYNETNNYVVVARNNDDDTGGAFAYCALGATSWTRSAFGVSVSSEWVPSYRSLVWDGTRYVMALYRNIYVNTSPTLAGTWTNQSTANADYQIHRMILLTDGRIVVVGVHGLCKVIDSNFNASDWTVTSEAREVKDVIEYDGSVYVCVYSNPAQIYKRVGNSWTSVLSEAYVSGNYVYFSYLCSEQ